MWRLQHGTSRWVTADPGYRAQECTRLRAPVLLLLLLLLLLCCDWRWRCRTVVALLLLCCVRRWWWRRRWWRLGVTAAWRGSGVRYRSAGCGCYCWSCWDATGERAWSGSFVLTGDGWESDGSGGGWAQLLRAASGAGPACAASREPARVRAGNPRRAGQISAGVAGDRQENDQEHQAVRLSCPHP